MTMPLGSAEEPTIEFHSPEAVAVRVVSSGVRPSKSVGTEFGHWRTYLLSASNPVCRVLNRTSRRHRALIAVNAVGSLAASQAEQSVANPAAGANATYTVPAGQTQTLLAANYQLVTSATVANRFMTIAIVDASGNVIYVAKNGSAVVATSTAQLYTAVGAAQVNSATGASTAPLPAGLVLQAGWQVQFTVTSIQAGDQISGVELVFSAPASQQTTDGVLLCSRDAANNILSPGGANNATPGVFNGGYVPIGGSVRWEVQQELHAVYPSSNGGPVYVTVCDELYASASD